MLLLPEEAVEASTCEPGKSTSKSKDDQVNQTVEDVSEETRLVTLLLIRSYLLNWSSLNRALLRPSIDVDGSCLLLRLVAIHHPHPEKRTLTESAAITTVIVVLMNDCCVIDNRCSSISRGRRMVSEAGRWMRNIRARAILGNCRCEPRSADWRRAIAV